MAQSSFNGYIKPKRDAGGTNTGDATAVASDIALGKSAYVKGVKVVGSRTSGSVVAITSSQSWTVPANVYYINVSVVGGGGSGSCGVNSNSGSYWTSGGGGGGGYCVNQYALQVTPGQSIPIVIGAGGAATTNYFNGSTDVPGNPGNQSTFNNSVVAFGGAGANGVWGTSGGGSSSGSSAGGSGGSGGGAGAGLYSPTTTGGGGTNGGNGGNSDISNGGIGQGTSTTTVDGVLRCGGGGGSGYAARGLGGAGGGGNGSSISPYTTPTAGASNYGGGGGGSVASANYASGSGGSGIVVIAY